MDIVLKNRMELACKNRMEIVCDSYGNRMEILFVDIQRKSNGNLMKIAWKNRIAIVWGKLHNKNALKSHFKEKSSFRHLFSCHCHLTLHP